MVQRRDFSTIRPTHKKFCLNARPCKLFRLQTVSLSQLMFTLEKAKYLSVYGLCSAQHCLTDGMVTQPLTFAEQRPDYFGVQLNGTHCECITTISFGEQWVVVVKLSRLTNSHMTQFGARHISYSSCLCAVSRTVLLVPQYACPYCMPRCLPSSAAKVLYRTIFFQPGDGAYLDCGGVVVSFAQETLGVPEQVWRSHHRHCS